jgi:hypothetical protein
MMKLDDYTITVLKNFATINPGLLLKKGKVQRTISTESAIAVIAEITDDIPVNFGIYDLSQFLGNINSLNNPEMSFDDKSVVMKDGDMKMNYFSCAASIIISPPDQEIDMDKVDVKFFLSNAVLQKILKLASMNGLPHIIFTAKDGELYLQANDANVDTSNFATTTIEKWSGRKFKITFATDKLKMIPDDYNVEISLAEADTGFARFTSKNGKLIYYIASEEK